MGSRRDVLTGLVGAGTVALLAQGAKAAPTHGGGGGGPSGLTRQDIEAILTHGVQTAQATDSALRGINGIVQTTRMHIAVVARDGRFLAIRSMEDAWVGSIDIAIAKARTAAFFSSNENALTSRIIGVLSQAHNPDGSGGAGPLWGIWASNQIGISGSQEFRNGLITFPGGVPLYKNGVLVGGVGVSGDGVDQDEHVAFGAAAGFEPPAAIAKLGF
ncbi:MAG TPA: heme-binding protein [Armatimonadota bacterium]|nr:heme-binding protein [Armatimonadota bacterium]